MPAKPRWLLQIPAIIESLSALNSPVVDRSVCERLFSLRRRRAIDLMHQFGGYQAGNTILIDRLALIEKLREIEADPGTVNERRRKERLSKQLDTLHLHRAATQVSIRVSADVYCRQIHELPEGVRLEAGRLTIEFAGAEQLLSKLFELSQAAANDFDRFCMVVEPQRPEQTIAVGRVPGRQPVG